MTRMTDEERDALKKAAETAKSILPKLQAQKLLVDDRIAKFQAVIDAWESISGRRSRTEASQASDGSVLQIRKRMPKGQVVKDIDQVLSAGGEYEEPELREAITEKVGVTYKRATIYTCLRRGQKIHKYLLKDKKWSWNPLNKAVSA